FIFQKLLKKRDFFSQNCQKQKNKNKNKNKNDLKYNFFTKNLKNKKFYKSIFTQISKKLNFP
ncbi:MAG: hypothetical protein MCS20_02390, partial [Candidatus Phytoplasma mali]|nr:hypothetical protein [Candidatus Phytoplasma mali]